MFNQARRSIGWDRISGPGCASHGCQTRHKGYLHGLSLFRFHHLKFPSSGFYKMQLGAYEKKLCLNP
jgi:hypothetical protein